MPRARGAGTTTDGVAKVLTGGHPASGVQPARLARRVRLGKGDPWLTEDEIVDSLGAGGRDQIWRSRFVQQMLWQHRLGRPQEARDVYRQLVPQLSDRCDRTPSEETTALLESLAAEHPRRADQ